VERVVKDFQPDYAHRGIPRATESMLIRSSILATLGAPPCRMFQRSIACETVGAVGPNAEHFLHATNFGRMSSWSQSSERPQNGQGSGCSENVTLASPTTSIELRNMLLRSLIFDG